MIARTLHFSRSDLLDCPFDELVEVWWPEAMRLLELENRT